MSKGKKRAKEEGAIIVMVVVTIFMFTLILMGAYISITTLKEAQLKSDIRIQQLYGADVERVDEIYDETTKGISAMYEELAGDEEGATAGKIHIGDYINYDPNPNNIATSAMTEDNGYKYVSSNDATGLADAIENGDITTDVTSQDFTVQSGTKWRVLGIDGNNLLITTKDEIIPNISVTDSEGNQGYYLYGAKAYENCVTEINNISKIYANGEGADKNKTRGMTIKDVNKITGVVANGTTLTPAGLTNIWEEGSSLAYGTTLTDFLKGTVSGWTPSAWVATSSQERADATKAPGITGNVTGYAYLGNDTTLKTANTSSIRYKMIFGEDNKVYWLASRGLLAYSGSAVFSPGFVFEGYTISCYFSGFDSRGVEIGRSLGVHPVVYLKSNITLTEASKTDEGVTTWNIEV